MSIAIFAPITVDESNNCIQLKKQSDAAYTSYYVDEDEYASLIDILDNLNNYISPDGYSAKLIESEDFAGFLVTIENDDSFTIQYPTGSGCNEILGFSSSEYATNLTSHTGDTFPIFCLRVNALKGDSGNMSELGIVNSISFANFKEFSLATSSIRRLLNFHAIDPATAQMLADIWCEIISNDYALTIFNDWDENLTENIRRKTYKPGLKQKAEIKFQRTWAPPQPLHYNIDIILELV